LQAVAIAIINEGRQQAIYQGGGQIPSLAVGVNTADIAAYGGGDDETASVILNGSGVRLKVIFNCQGAF
jgi:CRP-like cAMP-binding protein